MHSDIVKKIATLKDRHNAVILAHNYQVPEVQDIADFVGDSLDLSRRAASVEADVIVFCGVFFMAETAAILCPGKTVLIPDPQAGCPMVDMAPLREVLALKAKHPHAIVVAYVNSSAAVKAESDYCCTSANASQVVESLSPDAEIVFLPDQYLGSYVARQAGRDLILYPGYCPTHVKITDRNILSAKAEHPQARVMIHPECRPEVVALADAVLSTSGMRRYARKAQAGSEFIVGTETGLLHVLRKENPDKIFHAASSAAVCPNMKRISLEKVLWSLEDMQHEVRVAEEIRTRARTAVDRMVRIAGK